MKYQCNSFNIYEKPNVTKEWLRKNDFHYNHEAEAYFIRFPVHKYKKVVTLEGEIVVDPETGGIKIDVFMPNSRDFYPPFYDSKHGNHTPIMREIEKTVNKKFRKYGIRKRIIFE